MDIYNGFTGNTLQNVQGSVQRLGAQSKSRYSAAATAVIKQGASALHQKLAENRATKEDEEALEKENARNLELLAAQDKYTSFLNQRDDELFASEQDKNNYYNIPKEKKTLLEIKLEKINEEIASIGTNSGATNNAEAKAKYNELTAQKAMMIKDLESMETSEEPTIWNFDERAAEAKEAILASITDPADKLVMAQKIDATNSAYRTQHKKNKLNYDVGRNKNLAVDTYKNLAANGNYTESLNSIKSAVSNNIFSIEEGVVMEREIYMTQDADVIERIFDINLSSKTSDPKTLQEAAAATKAAFGSKQEESPGRGITTQSEWDSVVENLFNNKKVLKDRETLDKSQRGLDATDAGRELLQIANINGFTPADTDNVFKHEREIMAMVKNGKLDMSEMQPYLNSVNELRRLMQEKVEALLKGKFAEDKTPSNSYNTERVLALFDGLDKEGRENILADIINNSNLYTEKQFDRIMAGSFAVPTARGKDLNSLRMKLIDNMKDTVEDNPKLFYQMEEMVSEIEANMDDMNGEEFNDAMAKLRVIDTTFTLDNSNLIGVKSKYKNSEVANKNLANGYILKNATDLNQVTEALTVAVEVVELNEAGLTADTMSLIKGGSKDQISSLSSNVEGTRPFLTESGEVRYAVELKSEESTEIIFNGKRISSKPIIVLDPKFDPKKGGGLSLNIDTGENEQQRMIFDEGKIKVITTSDGTTWTTIDTQEDLYTTVNHEMKTNLERFNEPPYVTPGLYNELIGLVDYEGMDFDAAAKSLGFSLTDKAIEGERLENLYPDVTETARLLREGNYDEDKMQATIKNAELYRDLVAKYDANINEYEKEIERIYTGSFGRINIPRAVLSYKPVEAVQMGKEIKRIEGEIGISRKNMDTFLRSTTLVGGKLDHNRVK